MNLLVNKRSRTTTANMICLATKHLLSYIMSDIDISTVVT